MLEKADVDKYLESERMFRRTEIHSHFTNRLERELDYLVEEYRKRINSTYSSPTGHIMAFAIQEHPDATATENPNIRGRRVVTMRYNMLVIKDFIQRAFFIHTLGEEGNGYSAEKTRALFEWATDCSIPFCKNFYQLLTELDKAEKPYVLSPGEKFITFPEEYVSRKMEEQRGVLLNLANGHKQPIPTQP